MLVARRYLSALVQYLFTLLQRVGLANTESMRQQLKTLITRLSSACNCWAAGTGGRIASRIGSAARFAPNADSSEPSNMKRPLGVTVIAITTLLGATLLALGSFAFFFIGVLAITGGDGADPVSASIAGMGVAGGFSLLVLSGVAVCLAIGVLRLQEWARVVSIGASAAGIVCTILSILTFAGHPVIPVVPMVFCYVILIGAAVTMLAYLARPNVKQAFRTATLIHRLVGSTS